MTEYPKAKYESRLAPCSCGGEAELKTGRCRNRIWVECSECDERESALSGPLRSEVYQLAIRRWNKKHRPPGHYSFPDRYEHKGGKEDREDHAFGDLVDMEPT